MIKLLQSITPNEASELLNEDARKALKANLYDNIFESEEQDDLRKARTSALSLSHQEDFDDEQFDPLYYRTIPELDMYVKPLDSASGAHTSTFVDIDEEYVVQIPKEITPEEKRKQRDTRLEHYQTYLDEGIPVTGDWEGRDIHVDGEEVPILLGEYNPHLEDIEDLDGEERQKAEQEAEYIGAEVLNLMDKGRVSYKDHIWQQSPYGHRAWDDQRETVVVDDLGEYIE